MGIYGLEEQFWVEDYQFEVGFSNDNDVGLRQRDIYVAQRRKVEDLTLADFAGSQLLQGYRGSDADQRRNAYANRREALVASYKEARRAPHANSTQLLRHEKKDLKRLEQALAQELCQLSPDLFDLSRMQEQVKQTEHSHFLRSFYFDEVNERYIHNFCRKYATDAAYRATVEQGTAPWVERNALFVKNLTSQFFRETEGPPPDEDDERYFEPLSLAEEPYFRWICQYVKQILADPAYQRLRAYEQASEHACTMGSIDPEMKEVVAAWSQLSGVVVNKSCRGAGEVFRFGRKTLLVPSAHEERTMLVVSASSAGMSALEEVKACFPRICLGQSAGPLRQTSSESYLQAHLRSESVLENSGVRGDLVRLAEQLKARVQT